MIAFAMRPTTGRKWGSISFASTLHLCPILDLLLADVPRGMRDEVRLGLQEALVNAATHGNQLDPSKTVLVQFFFFSDQYWWIISDQGCGFEHSPDEIEIQPCEIPSEFQEDGRGMFILNQIFDQVKWNSEGTELRLCKHIKSFKKLPLLR